VLFNLFGSNSSQLCCGAVHYFRGDAMKKHSLIFSSIALVLFVIMLVTFLLPYLYVLSENNNFEKIRQRSLLNCTTMLLHCLIDANNIDEVKSYVASGKSLEKKDGWGQSALFFAVKNKKIDYVKLLLIAGADAKDDYGKKVLLEAVVAGSFDIANQLIMYSADVNGFSGGGKKETLLHFCSIKNKPECVAYLLGKGADTTLKDSYGYTVLDRIDMHEHISEAVKKLFDGQSGDGDKE
jgi:ankyrin repeat protein